ncbi:MAG: hypothetical protein CML22_14215 [Rheinheimera sp.]|nr:hypothetical protein [Rheinheimera sp.]MBM35439.1 hypothetical protein [Rheinheimera sp.]HAW93641.1 hypothetical protein [Candidatus Azambacteria bacterium]|tara:strand:- start:14 stop:1045 length:1032 start_codon:yes stop_codon:yes gene_type:complete
MANVLQVDGLRSGLPTLRNWDEKIQLYYDETNNIRRLTLTEVGLNASISPFVIAGIAIRNGGLPESSEETLRHLLSIQKSAKEIKYKHLAGSSYEDALGSEKVSVLLSWLLDNNIYIHYSILDILYWSILDIIESLMPGDPLRIAAFHHELKSELYYFVRQNPSEFLRLLVSYAYPNIERSQVSSFLDEISNFLDDQEVEDRSLATTILKQTISQASRYTGLELQFLHDNEPGELIGDFSVHFLHCTYLFKNASHTFDKETYVEKILANLELRDGANKLNYKFIDSKESLGVQISDVIAGLIGRHFGFISEHTLPVLREKKENFSQVQLHNLSLVTGNVKLTH